MTGGTVIEHIDREWINGPSGTVQTDSVIWGAVHGTMLVSTVTEGLD